MMIDENPEIVDKENRRNLFQVAKEAKGTKGNLIQDLKQIKLQLIQAEKENKDDLVKKPFSQMKQNKVPKDPEQIQREKAKRLNKEVAKNESNKLLVDYGEPIYAFSRLLSMKNSADVKEDFYQRHLFNPNIRTKMVDWMIEVLGVYSCSTETFFLSVHIMDLYISKTKEIITNEKIHLLGMTSMFIASKFLDYYPISMSELVSKIGHCQYVVSAYKAMERKILNAIGMENIVSVSSYEFLKTFFADFDYNNMHRLKEEKGKKFYEYSKETALLLSKLICHFEKFYKHEDCFNSIACLIAGIKLTQEAKGELCSEETKKCFVEWVEYLVANNKYNMQEMAALSEEIVQAYKDYFKTQNISFNLMKFSPLSYKC
ncbi:MAG: hypothetical protein MJ252_25815 [archaeon]|nr:hypothetical protein [archaeon]